MSALWASCPNCGPLFTIMPQGGNQFEIDVRCSCGLRIHHKENGNPGTAYHKNLARFKGKTPCSPVQDFTNNEQDSLLNNCFD